jgi:hypothetical protein
MPMLPKELTSAFLTPIEYSMATGSLDWIGIKTNFETLNDEITGVIFAFDQGKIIERNALEDARIHAQNFWNIAFEYEPKNYDESQEQDLLLVKVKTGLDIYAWLWERID